MSKGNNKKPESKSLKKIKSSLFSRGVTLAKISVSAGTKLAAQGITKAFQNEEERNNTWKNFIKDQAQVLTKELGELKGSLMKAGQMLSVYGEHFLPPEANQFLRGLQQDSPPVEWKVMDKILTDHLGKEKRQELEIDPVSIGTASLGQVHKAKIIKTGETIALKIQYPNVEKAIDSDLKAIKSFLYLVKILPKDFKTDHIFDEIRTMLQQETDYNHEAELTQQYGDLLAGDTRFVVPKIYPRYSNKRVLATSFETGVRVDDPMIQKLSQERRNRMALNFMDLYLKEVFEWQFVQTDPHFGNYKIRVHQDGQDQIVLFDFGASRKYPDSFMKPYHRLIKSMYYNDKDGFEAAARKLKFLEENDSPGLKKIFAEMCFDLVEPFLHPDDPRNTQGLVDKDGVYDWKNTDLPERSSKKIMTMLKNFEWRTPPKEIIFLDRKAAGVFIFLSHLQAKIRGRELLESYLSKVP